MQTSSTAAAAMSPAPTLTEGVEAWSTLCAKLAERARLDAEIVELTGRVQRSGTIELIEGVPLDTALNLVHRLPASERGMMLTAADVLADMPQTMNLMRDRTLSYGQVRAIVSEAKRLSRDERAELDAQIGASAERLPKIDPDDAIDAIRIAVEELRGIRAAERAEEQTKRASFLWAQPGMFGAGTIYGQLDNVSLTTVLNRVDAMAPADDGRSLSQRRADGLVALAAHDCDDDAPVGSRSGGDVTILVALDTENVTVTSAGTIDIAAPGCLPTVTAKAAEALAADASVQVVLFEGGRPLTVTKKLRTESTPKAVRTAVKVRDRGDRFPGARRKIEHVHHFDKHGVGHHVDKVIGLSEPSHRRVHRHGWKVTLDPATAEATFTRGERTWVTLPRGTRLRRPPPAARGKPDAPPDG